MEQLLVQVTDKTRVEELEPIGHVTFTSKYSNFICFECEGIRLPELSNHPIVENWSRSPAGTISV